MSTSRYQPLDQWNEFFYTIMYDKTSLNGHLYYASNLFNSVPDTGKYIEMCLLQADLDNPSGVIQVGL